MKNKMNAILKMKQPQTKTKACSFIGAVNYYRSLWPHRGHLLAPVSKLTGNNKIVWEERKERDFNSVKALMVSNCINKYPNDSKTFHIYTDASDYQLGAAIIQDSKLITHSHTTAGDPSYSKKLTNTQHNYATTKKELLSIVMCLKEYCKILQGGVVYVYTDNQNLTFNTFSVQQVLCWRIFMDDLDCLPQLY